MQFFNGENKICTLLAAYLATQQIDDAHPDNLLPRATVLPLVVCPTSAARLYPSVEIWVPSFHLPHQTLPEYEVSLDLHLDETTSPATELDYLCRLRHVLCKDQFMNYLFTLPADQRADFNVRNFNLTGGSTTEDSAERRRTRRTSARCSFQSYEFTA